MKYERRFDLRNPLRHAGPRFCVHVIDGPGEPTPGRIRTLRFDYNCDAADWLSIEWVTSGGRRVGINGVNLTAKHVSNGSRFVLEAYEDEPNERKRTEGRRLFEEWAAKIEAGQKVMAFPDSWLPSYVEKIKEAAKEKDKPFAVPEFTDGEPKAKKGGAA